MIDPLAYVPELICDLIASGDHDAARRLAAIAQDPAKLAAVLGEVSGMGATTPIHMIPLASIAVDPERFQFRRGADDESGTVRDIPPGTFDPAKCKPLAVWEDPADGRTYLVDGHHRYEWAERDGVESLPVFYIPAKTAAEAKAVGERLNVVGGTVKMADDAIHVNGPPVAKAVSQNSGQDGPPASDEVALAGKDGKALAKLIRESKDHGVQTLHQLTLDAMSRFRGGHLLLNPTDVERLADALAAVNSTADLLGRSRVREMADRATTHGSLATFADHSLSTFADGFPGILATPNDALAYFAGLFPTLSVDPQRWEGEQRRRAFTLAESANRALTRRVQELIADATGRNIGVADATARIRDALSGAGVTPRNPQYAEMVFRTNAMDSFQTGMWEEGTAEDVTDLFPVWQYLGIDDERAGADHRPKFDRYYPRLATFAAVRGNRPYNCRCSMRWVDQWEWADTEAAGGRAETRWAA